jgi:tetratricopeptide (TPR) repeat protein
LSTAGLAFAFGVFAPRLSGGAWRRAFRLDAAHGNDDTAASLFMMRALWALGTGRWGEAYAALERTRRHATAAQNHLRRADYLAIRAVALAWQGRLDEARAHGAEAAALCRSIGYAHILAFSYGLECDACIALGRPEEALRLHAERLALLPDEDYVQRVNRGVIAPAHLLCGDLAAARRTADATLALMAARAPASGMLYLGYVATCETFLALWATGARDDLPRQAERAIRLMFRYARIFPIGRPAVLRFAGWARRLSGDARGARRAFAASLDAAQRIGTPVVEALARYELGRLGDGAHLEAAAAAFARFGAKIWHERATQSP